MNRTTRNPATLWSCWVPLTTLGCLLVVNCCAAARLWRSRTTERAGDAIGLEVDDELVIGEGNASLHRHRRQVRLETTLAAQTLAEQHLCHRDAATLAAIHASSRRGATTPTEATVAGSAAAETCAGRPAALLRFAGLTPGQQLELSYEESQAAAEQPWATVVPLATWYPIAHRRIIVRLPANTPLHWTCLACAAPPQVTATPESGEHVFTLTDLPAVHVADMQAARLELGPGQPRLVLSTTDSWTTLCEPLLTAFRAAAAVSDAVQHQVRTLSESAPTRALAITAVRRFVAERTVNGAIEAWQPRPVDEILTVGPRDALDQAVLLSALLHALDLPNRPVLIAREALFARDIPSLDQFGALWLTTPSGAGEEWLEPGTLRPGGLARLGGLELLDLETGVFENPQPMREQSVSSLSGSLTVHRDGSVRAQLELVMAGAYSPFFVAAEDTARLLDQLLPPPMNAPWQIDCDGCTVLWRELSPTQSVTSVIAQSRAVAVGRFWSVALPFPAGSQLLAPHLSTETCLAPIALDAAGREQWSIRVELADELTLASHPPTALLSNNAGQLSITSHMIGSTLTLGGELTLPSRILDQDACLSAHDLRRELGRANNRALLIERLGAMNRD